MIDLTPGFNLHADAGGGIPFISRGNGSSGLPPAPNHFAGGGGGGGGGGSQPAAAPTQTSTGGSTYVDPYAQYGGKGAYDSLVAGFNNQKQNIYGTAGEATSAFGSGYGRNITDFLENERLGQTGIDTKAAKNELAKIQGVAGVLGMVGRGVKSGGVLLANRNAGSSSAAQAIANAYGDLGRRQLGSVGNQYELGNQDIANDQSAFDVQKAQGVRHLLGSKEDAVNKIVLDARGQFAALDAAMADKSLPQRIAIEQEKETVRQQTLAALQGLDAQLTQGAGGIQASSIDARREQAAALGRAGTDLGADAFQYTTETPADFQPGPTSSELPLFTLGRKRAVA